MQDFICLYFARSVARDIGGADPERMAPLKVEEYISEVFKNTDIKIQVISDLALLKQEYPLFVAVDRAARSEFCLELSCMFYTWRFYVHLCGIYAMIAESTDHLHSSILLHVYVENAVWDWRDNL